MDSQQFQDVVLEQLAKVTQDLTELKMQMNQDMAELKTEHRQNLAELKLRLNQVDEKLECLLRKSI